MFKVMILVLLVCTSTSFGQQKYRTSTELRKISDFTYIANMDIMEKEQHQERVTAIKLARQDLLNDKSVDQIKVFKFFDIISTAALAEGDQRNTIFNREGLVYAFKNYDGNALINYLGILNSYSDVLKSDKTLSAGERALRTAIISYQVNELGSTEDEAEYQTVLFIDANVFGPHPHSVRDAVP